MKFHIQLVWFSVLTLCSSFTVASVTYRLTDMGGFGGADSRAIGINNHTEVVGWAFMPEQEISHAYRYSDGSLSNLHPPSAHMSQARGINNSGSVAGMTVIGHRTYATLWHNGSIVTIDPNGSRSLANALNDTGQVTGNAHFGGFQHAFKYENGNFSDLGTLGGAMSSGLAINASGNIVGYSLTSNPDWQQRAFVYSTGDRMRDLGTLGGLHSQANGINDQGQIVGWSWNENDRAEAFVWSQGNMVGLGNLGGFSSYAQDINEHGDIVGSWSPDGFTRLAFVIQNGIMADLNALIDPLSGWSLVEANAINDSGCIVGFGIDPFGIDRGFLLTPIPSPCSLVYLLSFGAFLRRSR